MTAALFDCFSGVSGDMVLGALLDAGAPETRLRDVVAALGLEEEVRIGVARERRAGLAGTRVTLTLADGGGRSRSPRELLDLVGERLDPALAAPVRATLEALIAAEAGVHGTEIPHLHEAGGADALVDIAGAHALMAGLGIESWYVSPLASGRGWAMSGHGPIPVPAPAALQLVSAAGATLVQAATDRELLTPTGAALVLTGGSTEPAPPIRVRAAGYGLGAHELPWPNALRVVVGDVTTAAGDEVDEVETEIDDMPGTLLADLPGILLDAGALDAYITPVLMKKGRPGHLVTALAPAGGADAIARLLLAHTSTLGCRITRRRRVMADRRGVEFETPFGRVRFKVAEREGAGRRVEPEMEDCRRIAAESGRPLLEIHRELVAAGLRWLERTP